ncbi:phosphoethanolamine transferase [Shewanella subflava]|uniref:Phosphoethanolamine--lipid A transferase n=1 Tax=Shewanella subflava TaxID=2986476 RepID=A0ABT3I7V4_9GAMM|nr:phosphoethanolamine--lipid A transferase [Shewanella subflava]MCW3172116.1 phosphoethanolamine--lipid A transferase [Shewanella subflava]
MLKLLSRFYNCLNSVEVTKETLIIWSALYFAVVINFPINQRIFQLTTEGHGFFSFTPAIVLTGFFMLIFSILSSRFIFKPLMTLLLLTSAAAMYATLKYNVLFDYAMMENIFETHSGEAFSYLNISSVAYFFVFGVLPTCFLWLVKIKPASSINNTFLRRMALGVTGLLLVGGVVLFFYKDYVSVGRNHHYLNKMIIPAHIFNTVKYVNNKYFTEALPYNARATDAKVGVFTDTKPTLFVLMVGETARAKNMAYYGYGRNTNPYTQELGLIRVNDVTSCGTSTAHSLPCMISDLNHSNYKREQANAQDNVLDVMKQAGVDVVWFENDGGDKEVAARGTKVDISMSEDPVFCDGLSCFDEVLVQKLSTFLSDKVANQADTPLSNQMVALHMIGSHGPTYFKRYPAEMQRFTPACNRSDIENCTDEEIVNVYDNTLVYTDYVLAKTIALLEQYSDQYHVALVYLSDHGESLGENGIYLHGTPYAFAPSEQIHVPWLMWLPENYTQAKQLSRQCIIQQAQRSGHSHDNLFHTLLGLYGIETHLKNSQLDISHECKLD